MPSSEAPLISKGLKLVSFAIILSLAAIALTAGYSGYQEYKALTNLAGSSNASQLSASINGTKFELSGLTIPNNMTYPLDLQLLGHIFIQNQSVASFDSGRKVIQPGQVAALSIVSELNFSNVVKNPEVFRGLLLNTSLLLLNLTILAGINPLLAINITTSKNSSIGPVLEGFHAQMLTSQATRSSNGNSFFVPITLSWFNPTPVAFNGSLSITVTKIPGSTTTGNYGDASGPLALKTGQNSVTLNATFPSSDFASGVPPSGSYTFDITATVDGSSATFPEVVSA
ncbi:MAG: hypothetical protein ACYC7D_14970 [Nitrososphaerales archaeon]